MKLLFLCIGSEKICGDSFGPMVGTLLRERYQVGFPVIGTESSPVNGVNLSGYREHIKACFPYHKIIAIDAALGDKKDLWRFRFREGGVSAGGALGSGNPTIGDLGILAVVGEKGGDVLSTLMNVPFAQVARLAESCAKLLVKTFCPEKLNGLGCYSLG